MTPAHSYPSWGVTQLQVKLHREGRHSRATKASEWKPKQGTAGCLVPAYRDGDQNVSDARLFATVPS